MGFGETLLEFWVYRDLGILWGFGGCRGIRMEGGVSGGRQGLCYGLLRRQVMWP
jgi:hypothetical protein